MTYEVKHWDCGGLDDIPDLEDYIRRVVDENVGAALEDALKKRIGVMFSWNGPTAEDGEEPEPEPVVWAWPHDYEDYKTTKVPLEEIEGCLADYCGGDKARQWAEVFERMAKKCRDSADDWESKWGKPAA
jgi:hypothetical protein